MREWRGTTLSSWSAVMSRRDGYWPMIGSLTVCRGEYLSISAIDDSNCDFRGVTNGLLVRDDRLNEFIKVFFIIGTAIV
mgnify:CR=1 FL=1